MFIFNLQKKGAKAPRVVTHELDLTSIPFVVGKVSVFAFDRKEGDKEGIEERC